MAQHVIRPVIDPKTKETCGEGEAAALIERFVSAAVAAAVAFVLFGLLGGLVIRQLHAKSHPAVASAGAASAARAIAMARGRWNEPGVRLLLLFAGAIGVLSMGSWMQVGGRFTVESVPGAGTSICAEIPFTNGHRI